MKAKVIPWSSVVGTGILLTDDKGQMIALLNLMNVQYSFPELKEKSMELVEAVAKAINEANERMKPNAQPGE